MENKIKQIQDWFTNAQNEYNNHSMMRNNLITPELYDKHKELHTEMITLEKVLGILLREGA